MKTYNLKCQISVDLFLDYTLLRNGIFVDAFKPIEEKIIDKSLVVEEYKKFILSDDFKSRISKNY